MQSRIAKFMERHRKAVDPTNPFPMDRVFPSNDDIRLFGEEMRDFCEGYVEIVEELEKYRAQMRSMSV